MIIRPLTNEEWEHNLRQVIHGGSRQAEAWARDVLRYDRARMRTILRILWEATEQDSEDGSWYIPLEQEDMDDLEAAVQSL